MNSKKKQSFNVENPNDERRKQRYHANTTQKAYSNNGMALHLIFQFDYENKRLMLEYLK